MRQEVSHTGILLQSKRVFSGHVIKSLLTYKDPLQWYFLQKLRVLTLKNYLDLGLNKKGPEITKWKRVYTPDS